MHLNSRQTVILTVAALACACFHPGALAQEKDAALVKRGAQLVAFGDCVTCHTPSRMGPKGPEKDTVRGLSGHPQEMQMPQPPKLEGAWNWAGAASMTAFAGPWGVSFAANLTPDRDTGIGNWREEDFIKAMRSGKHLGIDRPIQPPMPWEAVGSLPDADLRALFTYLKSQPAVKNKVPAYMPPPKP